MATDQQVALATDGGDAEKLPGHWVLARLGKRVLRPGGRELTEAMQEALAIGPSDEVVEFAPGLGATARLTLARRPAAYTAVERDASAAEAVRRQLGEAVRVIDGTAEETGLEDASATVVYGEAMLTMQTAERKRRIVAEAARVLRPGGRYGIHELALRPDAIGDGRKQEVAQAVSGAIHHLARPLTGAEWRALLAEHGFEVEVEATAPMALLEPRRMLADEGLAGVARILFRILTQPDARRRVLAMRKVFRAYRADLGAVMLVARKKA